MKEFFGKDIKKNLTEEFTDYIRFGGFPKTLEFDSPNDKETYIEGVISQILDKDVLKHNKIKNKAVFDRVMTYIINNFGATTSVSNIANYFREKENTPIKTETLNNYISILENAKIIYKCPRFDVKSKKALKGEEKYYLQIKSDALCELLQTRTADSRLKRAVLYHLS